MSTILLSALGFVLILGCGLVLFGRWGCNWGATREERAASMPGDTWLEGGPSARVRMTRAVTVEATTETVWRWLAQLGRGAGWYSFDLLDNGGKTSARHLVSWIPPPEIGDATAVGYVRHLDPGRSIVWWIPGGRILGVTFRSVMVFAVRPIGDRARIQARFSWDAAGLWGTIVLRLFQLVDTVMAVRQLANLKRLIETHAAGERNADQPETGERDQYQLYEVIYASGEAAGRVGKENARTWRRAAIRAGVLESR